MAQIKGTGMLNVVKGLKFQPPDALEALPESLRHYLDSKILVASWYPANDFMALLRYLCQVLPTSTLPDAKDPWHWFGRRSAAIDLVEIYSSMLQRGRPWRTLERFPRLWRLYFDTGKVEVAMEGDHQARIEIRDFPYADLDYCRHLTGYLHEALHLSGAKGIETRVLHAASSSQPASLSIRWSD